MPDDAGFQTPPNPRVMDRGKERAATSAIPPRGPTRAAEAPKERKTLGSLKDAVKDKAKDLSGRAKAVKEILGLACMPLAAAAAIQTARSGDPNQVSPYALDIYTVQMHGDALSEAVAELSETYHVLGAVLDKIAALTPSATIFGVGILIFMQISENHGKLPEGARSMAPVPILSRYELAEMVKADAENQAAQAASGNGA